MLEKFKQILKEQMNAIYGGAQTVEDINRVQPN